MLLGMKLPGWVTNDRDSVERESAPWRDRSEAERAQALAAVCRAAAKILAARDDRQAVFDWVDPLPAHSLTAIRRLRQSRR